MLEEKSITDGCKSSLIAAEKCQQQINSAVAAGPSGFGIGGLIDSAWKLANEASSALLAATYAAGSLGHDFEDMYDGVLGEISELETFTQGVKDGLFKYFMGNDCNVQEGIRDDLQLLSEKAGSAIAAIKALAESAQKAEAAMLQERQSAE